MRGGCVRGGRTFITVVSGCLTTITCDAVVCDPVSSGSISSITILYKCHVNVVHIVIVCEVVTACRWFYVAVEDDDG